MSPHRRDHPAAELRAPRIPAALAELTVDGTVDDPVWEGCEVRGSLAGAEIPELDIVDSAVRSVAFTGATVESFQASDTTFESCELSGALLESAVLTRVEFRSCRMTGVVAPRSRLRDVRFVDCQMVEANLRACRGVGVGFESSNLRDADFYDSELIGAHLFDCDLTGTELSKVRMAGARLQGSTLEAVKGAGSFREVVIDTTQIVPLALRVFAALGITIDDDRTADGGDDSPSGR